MKTTDPPIVVSHTYPATQEQLWIALTDLTKMKKWYFENIDAFEPIVGSTSHFEVVSEGRTFTHLWRVVEVEPFEKIVYNWRYEEYSGDSNVSFELFQLGSENGVEVTVEVLEDFPENVPEFKRESCIGGWNYFLKERLKAYFQENRNPAV